MSQLSLQGKSQENQLLVSPQALRSDLEQAVARGPARLPTYDELVDEVRDLRLDVVATREALARENRAHFRTASWALAGGGVALAGGLWAAGVGCVWPGITATLGCYIGAKGLTMDCGTTLPVPSPLARPRRWEASNADDHVIDMPPEGQAGASSADDLAIGIGVADQSRQLRDSKGPAIV